MWMLPAAAQTDSFSQTALLDLQELAYAGDLSAQYAYAKRLESAHYIAGHTQQASEWMHKSAKGGYVPAQRNLAQYYARGIGGAIDHRSASLWYARAAKNGDLIARAELLLRKGYAVGMPIESGGIGDFATLITDLTQAATEKDDTDAQLMLGLLLSLGLHSGDQTVLAPNYSQARQWLRLAYPRLLERVRQGGIVDILQFPLIYGNYSYANEGVGLAYRNLERIPIDEAPVLQALLLASEVSMSASRRDLVAIGQSLSDYEPYVRHAAQFGDPGAISLHATMKIFGMGVEFDAESGVAMLESVVRRPGLLDYSGGSEVLAFVYSAEYLPHYADEEKLMANLAMAARNGSADAQTTLGSYYFHGTGGLERDLDAASQLLTSASEQNHPDAQLLMSELVSERGAGQDEKILSAGYTWLIVAESNGLVHVPHQLLNQLRSFYQAALSPQQTFQAVQKAEAFIDEFRN